MAQQFLSINRGQLDALTGNVVTATSAPSADFYLQILSTNTPTRKDVLMALDAFKQFIMSNGMQSGSAGTNLPVL